MVKSSIPLYRLEMTASSGTVFTPIKWPVDGFGRNRDANPIVEELGAFVQAFEESLKLGGDNHQLGLDSISDASIIRQSDGEIVVHWNREE